MDRKTTNLIIILAIAIVVIFSGFGLFGLSGFNMGSAPAEQTASAAQAILDEIQSTGTVTDLRVADITAGTGEEVKAGDTITVNYTGFLPDGSVFDSSLSRNEPFTFVVGSGSVIQGWELGLIGMKEGGRRLLAIPPALGYGANAVGPIPANSTLIFDVELLKRETGSTAPAAE